MLSDTILVTGGAGFIGCNFVRDWLNAGLGKVVNLDKLTYAAAKFSGIPPAIPTRQNLSTRS